MIISHKYKYIFLKTTKTAGTSIEIALSKFCGEDDIITPISSKDEQMRKDLGVFPRNYHHTRPLELKEYRPKHLRNLILEGKQPQFTVEFWNHMPASKIRKGIGTKIWNSYFKFCFVRNPWDRAVSRYYWNIEKTGKEESLDVSLKKNDPNSNFCIYAIDNKVAVDYVGKYENLMEDLSSVCDRLGIPFDNWLPRAKGGSRKDRRHYSEVLTEQQANFIREKCAPEIELFGYEF